MREQVRGAACARVLLTAPDRVARTSGQQLVLLEDFEAAGCQVEVSEQPLSHRPQEQWVVQSPGAVAAYERSLSAERRRRGRPQK